MPLLYQLIKSTSMDLWLIKVEKINLQDTFLLRRAVNMPFLKLMNKVDSQGKNCYTNKYIYMYVS